MSQAPKVLKLTKPEPQEAQVLKAVLRALELHPSVAKVWRMNTGSGNLARKSGHSQWINFGFKGSPDIHGYMKDGTYLAIEVKKLSGVVSDDQKQFIADVLKNGGCAGIARSVEDAFKIIGDFYAARRGN